MDEVRKIAAWMPVSRELLFPEEYPRTPPLPRRARLRWWLRDHLGVYAMRQRLSYWIDPDPYKDDRDA